jgi:hypothetical protein
MQKIFTDLVSSNQMMGGGAARQGSSRDAIATKTNRAQFFQPGEMIQQLVKFFVWREEAFRKTSSREFSNEQRPLAPNFIA